ncbi:hypothetical protein GCM10009720_08810 [Yaniella flava]|uniref:Uncharacterized protein n=1 Tax=Yaniella flava TaxID=287930 RepID=A0ABP5FNR3_9MICC
MDYEIPTTEPRLRARRNPKALRSWLHDEAAQQQVEDIARLLIGDLTRLIKQHANELAAGQPGLSMTVATEVPESLIATRIAKAIENEAKRQVEQVASAARAEYWAWSAIAEATGLQPTTDPRFLYPGIEDPYQPGGANH